MEPGQMAIFHSYRVVGLDQLTKHIRDQDYHVLHIA